MAFHRGGPSWYNRIRWLRAGRPPPGAGDPPDTGPPSRVFDADAKAARRLPLPLLHGGRVRRRALVVKPPAPGPSRPGCAGPPACAGCGPPSMRSSSPGWRATGWRPAPEADRRTLDPPGDVRPDRPAADARRGRRLRERHRARRLREAGRAAARVAALRREVGPALARRRALRRDGGVRVRPPPPRGVAVPRLRHRRASTATSPTTGSCWSNSPATRSTPTSDELRIAAGFNRLGPVRRNAGNQELAFSRNEVLTEMADAAGDGVPRPDGRLRPLPRPQVRRHLAGRLLPLPGVLGGDARARRRAGRAPTSRPQWKAKTDTIQAEIKKLQKSIGRADRRRAGAGARTKLKELEASLPPPLPAISTVRNVAAERTPVHVLKRGNTDKKGRQVGPKLLDIGFPGRSRSCPPTPRTRGRPWPA